MAEIVYILCGLTSAACAILLLRGFWRSGARLLLWSGLCFISLTFNNLLLFLDKVVYPNNTQLFGIDFAVLRGAFAFIAIAILLFGLVWDSD